MMKSKAGQRPQKEKTATDDKYYMIHQRKPIIISAEEVERIKRQGGGKLTTFEELIAKDEDRRERHRIANRKNAKKRYANNKELQEAKKEVEIYKNILSQEEARAEAEKRAEKEERGKGFELLLEDHDIDPLNRLLCYITGTDDEDENGEYLARFMKKNNLKNIDYYEEYEDQQRQIQKIINKLDLGCGFIN